MAVSFDVEHKRTSEYRFYPEDVVIRPDLNGRHDLPNIDWLIHDILKNGQIQPVTIRNDGGKPVLTAGFSRWRALSEINSKKLAPVKMQLRCTYLQCTEQEGFLACISENRQRNATSDIDDAHNIKKLLNVYAMTEEQVSSVYFPAAHSPEEVKAAVRWVKKRAALIGLTREAEKAVQNGRIKGPAAVAIAKLSAEQQKQIIKGDGKITSADVRKAAGKPASTGAKNIKAAIQGVIETGKFMGIDGRECEASDDLIEFLASVLGAKTKGATA